MIQTIKTKSKSKLNNIMDWLCNELCDKSYRRNKIFSCILFKKYMFYTICNMKVIYMNVWAG